MYGIECLYKYCKIVVTGFVIALCYHLILGYFWGLGWPFNTFLFKPNDRFMDFFSILSDGYNLVNNLADPFNTPYVTTPGYIWISLLLGLVNKWIALYTYIFVLIGFLVWYLVVNIKKLQFTTLKAICFAVVITLTSFPLYFLLDRGNIEGLQFIVLALFITAYLKQKYVPSVLLLSMAFCMKPFAIVFIVLFLDRDKLKYLGLFLVTTLAITLGGLSILPGGLVDNFRGMAMGLQYYDKLWVLGPRGTQFNHTIYTPLWYVNMMYEIISPLLLKRLYFIAHSLLFILVSIYLMNYESMLWRKIFILYLCMIGLPYISGDYTLVNLYVPAILLWQNCKSVIQPVSKKYQIQITILLGILMIPKEYFSGFIIPVGISVLINPILVYIMLYLLVKYGLYERNKNMVASFV